MINYQQQPRQLVTSNTFNIGGCLPGLPNQQQIEELIINPNLSDSYNNITVKGVIKHVKTRIVPTDSVIVDALLAGGEALDCYNKVLQDEGARTAWLNNLKLAGELLAKEQSNETLIQRKNAIIQALSDLTNSGSNFTEEQKANLYESLANFCCVDCCGNGIALHVNEKRTEQSGLRV